MIAAAKYGDGLLQVGDSVGIHIPRACQTGLCGSCTCDVLDTTADDGRQVIRACQAGVYIPDGGRELVVDVARMKNAPRRKDPLARFENLDTEYVAGAAPKRRGLKNIVVTCETCDGTGYVNCPSCDGSGLEYIDKDGNILMDDLPPWMRSKLIAQGEGGDDDSDRLDLTQYECSTCLGMRTTICPDCQGRGTVER